MAVGPLKATTKDGDINKPSSTAVATSAAAIQINVYNGSRSPLGDRDGQNTLNVPVNSLGYVIPSQTHPQPVPIPQRRIEFAPIPQAEVGQVQDVDYPTIDEALGWTRGVVGHYIPLPEDLAENLSSSGIKTVGDVYDLTNDQLVGAGVPEGAVEVLRDYSDALRVQVEEGSVSQPRY
jgi:hypothetical protein